MGCSKLLNESDCLRKNDCKWENEKCSVKTDKKSELTPYEKDLKNYLKYKQKYLNLRSQLKNDFSYLTGGNVENLTNVAEDINEWEYEYPKAEYDSVKNELIERNNLLPENERKSNPGFPDVLINKPKIGLAIWYNPTSFIVKHEMKDEQVAHSVPSFHRDFLYTTIRLYIEPDLVPYVQSISGSVMLDLLKKEVSARCGSLAANYATLRTVIEVIQNKKLNDNSVIISNNNIEENKEIITSLYKKNIGNKDDDKEKNYEYIKIEVPDNHKAYENELERECHNYSFSDCT